MKLAEALIRRADIQKHIEQLESRLRDNASYQEGTTPTENPHLMLKELSDDINELQDLIARINKTNFLTQYEGRTLTEMMAEKDARSKEITVIRKFLKDASENRDFFNRNEIRRFPSVDVPELRRQVDEKARELRLLDIKLQELNWKTDLM